MTLGLEAHHLEQFRRDVEARLGLTFDDGKLGFLAEVLGRQLEAERVDVDGYLAKLGQLDLTPLARELTVSETYFFRNHEQFRALGELVLPHCVRANPLRRRPSLLSAGCASGDEAYTLAMVARTVLSEWPTVLAVDVNPSVLERARAGRYSSWALRETSPEVRRQWFHEEGREYVLSPHVRAQVRFEARNLVQDDPELWADARYDVVFCRNVLMYFRPQTAAEVVHRIANALVPGGFLFLGHAETLRGLSHEFHLHHSHGTFYYQRKGGLALTRTRVSTLEPLPASPAPAIAAPPDGDGWMGVIEKASARVRDLTQPHAGPEHVVVPRSEDVHRALLLVEQERFADALEALQTSAPLASPEPERLLLHAVLLVHTGRFAEAEAACRELLLVDDLNAGAHYVLALCRESVGDLAAAQDRYQVATYLDPGFAMPRLHLGLLARKQGDRGQARTELQRALVLLQGEEPSRLLLFGGGFGRAALVALCQAELQALRGADGA